MSTTNHTLEVCMCLQQESISILLKLKRSFSKKLLDLYKATGIPPEAVIENEYIPAVELNCQL